MRRVRLLQPSAFLLLGALLGVACSTSLPWDFASGDGGRADAGAPPTRDGGSPGSDGGLPFARACDTLLAERCAYLVRCGLLADDAASLEACHSGLTATWCGPTTWPGHVAVGTLRYDALHGQACAEAFATRACGEWRTLPDACHRLTQPAVLLRQPCYDGFDECLEGVCRGAACPRLCQPRGQLGEACRVSADCRSSLFCRPSLTMPGSGQCAARGPVGSPCEADSHCLDGHYCLEGLCRLLPAVGASCPGGRCVDSAWCAPDADAGACRGRKGLGAACDGDECEATLVCDPLSSACAEAKVGAGNPCSPVQLCQAGLTCVGLTSDSAGLCLSPQELGAACAQSGDCRAHLACLPGDGGRACSPRLADGAPCAEDRHCLASSHCVAGRCAPLPLPGEPCATSHRCRWGLCREVPRTDAGWVCGALLGAGEACATSAECASGTCAGGACIASCQP